MRSRLTYLLLGVLGLALLVGSPANAGQLRVDIESMSARPVAAGQPALVRFTLTNTSTEDAFILDYQTPLKGYLEEGLFRVVRNGQEVPYQGIHALRVGPLRENWVRIAAGDSVSGVIDLANDYPMHLAGTYVVYFDAALQVFRGNADRLPVADMDKSGRMDQERTNRNLEDAAGLLKSVAVNAAPTRLVVRGNAAAREHGNVALPGEKAFVGCSASLQSDLLNRQAAGRANALRGYNNATSFNSWYQTYFGNSSGSVSTVRSRFANSYNRMGQTINYYCGSSAPYCSAGVVLYTYKTTTNTIYVCSAYASQSSSFRAHAVNHESYHWNTVAGADDVTYGLTQCRNLAASNPTSALRNADNYAYAADYAP